MKAIQVKEFGGPEVLEYGEVEEQHPQSNEVKVSIKAAGVNPAEAYVRTGNYAFYKPDLPFTPGFDGAGIVEEVGENVTHLDVGDRVYIAGILADRNTGTYAKKTVVSADCVHKLPDHLTFKEGAALGVPAFAAFRALFHIGKLQPGETVLIHGASGAVGLLAVQMAQLQGAVVIGTAGKANENGKRLILESGADHALSHITEDNFSEVMEITDGKGPDLIVEMLADHNLAIDLELIAHFGRIVIIGNRGEIEINPRSTMAKESSITGMAVWNASEKEHKETFDAISAYLENGVLKPEIGDEYPLSEAQTAQEAILSDHSSGKMILTMEE